MVHGKSQNVLYEKKYNIFQKRLAQWKNLLYTRFCCGMIAMKREVAVYHNRFSVERMSS